MFTAAWYFLKLSAFFDSLQPLFLALFIPREVGEDKGTILLFSNLVQRGQLSKGQRDSGDYLDCFDQKLQTDRHGMGQRGWTCADRIPAHLRWTPLPDMLKSGCHLLISSQTDTQHHQQPCRKVELEST